MLNPLAVYAFVAAATAAQGASHTPALAAGTRVRVSVGSEGPGEARTLRGTITSYAPGSMTVTPDGEDKAFVLRSDQVARLERLAKRSNRTKGAVDRRHLLGGAMAALLISYCSSVGAVTERTPGASSPSSADPRPWARSSASRAPTAISGRKYRSTTARRGFPGACAADAILPPSNAPRSPPRLDRRHHARGPAGFRAGWGEDCFFHTDDGCVVETHCIACLWHHSAKRWRPSSPRWIRRSGWPRPSPYPRPSGPWRRSRRGRLPRSPHPHLEESLVGRPSFRRLTGPERPWHAGSSGIFLVGFSC